MIPLNLEIGGTKRWENLQGWKVEQHAINFELTINMEAIEESAS